MTAKLTISLANQIITRTKLVLNAKIITAKLCDQLGIKTKQESLESNEIPTEKVQTNLYMFHSDSLRRLLKKFNQD